MALTTCPECSNEVSERAETCPQCGNPLKEKTPPGWYNDSSGQHSHQAYWDGEKWTGQTRPRPGQRQGGGIPRWVWVVGAVLIMLYWVGSLFSGGSDVEETFNEIAEGLEGDDSSASSANDRVSLEGQGDGETEAFSLSGGSYSVRTEVGNDCYYSFTLRDPSTGDTVERVTSMSEPGSTTVSVHGVDRGRYYVEVITGPAPACPWSQVWTSS